ncbi:MAG: glycosyltransferase family 4 protein [Bacteroidetes bacterium]|nr:glycosyltransferase family 4 protein [Bacteroidota bacterium]
MKIVHVINIRDLGGAENLLISFLPALRNADIQVSCLILHHINHESEATVIGSKILAAGVHVQYKRYRYLWSFGNILWLNRRVKEAEADLVHCHLRHAEIWMSLLNIYRKVAIPVVTTVHGYNDAYMNKFGLEVVPELKKSFHYKLTKWVTSRMNGVVYISNLMKDFYSRAHLGEKCKSAVIYHGYDFVLARKNENSVKRVGNEIHLVISGRIVERKGHRYAVEVVEELKSHGIYALLHIMGTGSYIPDLQSIIKDKHLEDQVVFHGYQSDIVEKIQQYDIALLPSYWEPFGLVFLDAFAAGIPVVTFDLPAGNEIVIHNKTGLLAEPFSVAGLTREVLTLLRDPDKRKELTENALKDLATRFSLVTMANKYKDFYNLILAK